MPVVYNKECINNSFPFSMSGSIDVVISNGC